MTRLRALRSRRARVALASLAIALPLAVLPVTGAGPAGALRTGRPAEKPGRIVSSTPIADAPAGSRGWRIVYRTTTAAGDPAVSSGTVYAPDGPAPKGGRFVVAWAHPTLGTGTDCTPSQAANPAAGIPGFAAMIAKGWVIASTDYTGLGSPGTLPYLIGAGEAHDVVDSVRAARNLPGAGAGRTFAVWGHSQGGHASLFTGELARGYAPELRLVGVAAAAPAAELPALVSLQWQNYVSWVIGSEVITLWPEFYPNLDAADVATPVALENAERLGAICITADVSGVLSSFGAYLLQPFFSVDPSSQPRWRARLAANTPAALRTVPSFVAQGLADTVVLPATTALLEQRWCAARAPVTVVWDANADHFDIPTIAAPAAVDWLSARFAGTKAPNSCGEATPVPPAVDPPRPT